MQHRERRLVKSNHTLFKSRRQDLLLLLFSFLGHTFPHPPPWQRCLCNSTPSWLREPVQPKAGPGEQGSLSAGAYRPGTAANTRQPGLGPVRVAVELHPLSSGSGRRDTAFNLFAYNLNYPSKKKILKIVLNGIPEHLLKEENK